MLLRSHRPVALVLPLFAIACGNGTPPGPDVVDPHDTGVAMDAPAMDDHATPSDAEDATSVVDAVDDTGGAIDAATRDAATTDAATTDAPSGDVASADAGDGGGAIGTPCSSDATCGGGSCLVGRCYRYTDEMLPMAAVPSPDHCRLRVGVDYPSGDPLRLTTVVPNSSGDRGYEATRMAGTWSLTMLSSNVSPYDTPRFRRAASGRLDVNFITGVTVGLGAGYGGVTQSMLSGYAAQYVRGGELVVLTKYAMPGGVGSYPYPLRMWRQSGGTWMSDLVAADIGTDGVPEVHGRADGTPDALVFGSTSVSIWRKALDVWSSSPLYSWGVGPHFGGEVTMPDPAGGSHVVLGTLTFPTDPSVGDLSAIYLHVTSAGTVDRMVTLPVGGHGYTLRDATLDAHGEVYAMITGPVSAGRYPTHVVRVTAAGATESTVANLESALQVCSLAVAPDATMYIAAAQDSLRPIVLRTYAP